MKAELASLLVITAIAAGVPILVGILRIRVAQVVLLLAGGIICGPSLLGLITIDDPISLLSELGLGLLFFLAGMELESRSMRGRSGKLAAAGWIISILLALGLSALLAAGGIVKDFAGFAIALTSTALGTLLPILRDNGRLSGRFGTYFMGAGAWGEFGPIIAIAVFLSTRSSWAALATLVLFFVIATIVGALSTALKTDRISRIVHGGYSTSSQTGVRLSMLTIVLFLGLAIGLGFDAVLGAFIAGILARRIVPREQDSPLELRLEAVAFGFFIPIFFVVSGAKLDVASIIANPLPMILAFVALFLVRAVPQFVIYRKAIPDPAERASFALLVGTALPIIVALTTIEVAAGAMTSSSAAALVGAGALTVLVFPLASSVISKRIRRSVDEGFPAPTR
jgi:Kef-type K+ transport system membrane component KefB